MRWLAPRARADKICIVYDKSARIYDLLYTGTGINDYDAEAGVGVVNVTELHLYHLVRTDSGID
jgi:hypothetical protein